MSKRDRQAIAQGLNDAFRTADLLGNVIQGDRSRRRTSQSSPAEAPVIANTDNPSGSRQTDNMTDKHYDNRTDMHYDNVTDKPADMQATGHADKLSSGQTDRQTIRDDTARPREKSTRKQTGAGLLQARIQEAQQMASSPTETVTLRLPTQLNQWLDEYVHLSWQLKIRKQKLVAEALRLLFARRGRPGEPILATELLPEDEP